MATLFAACLKNGRRFSTGITLPTNVAISPGEFYAYTRCPYCGVDHEWTHKDVLGIAIVPSNVISPAA